MATEKRFETPILLLIFNRPDTTMLVFEKIRETKPQFLYIAADGARVNSKDDKYRCTECKKIVSLIDWDCEIKTLFRDVNLGSKLAVSSAITWFFSQEKFGIILEDDCLPNKSFFFFCDTLLRRHMDDENIMHITGTNLNDQVKFGDGSYYHSIYPNVWGWATWKRAWDKFDLELSDENFYHLLIEKKFKYISERHFWKSRLYLVKSNLVSAWDYQWMFSIWKENGICLNSNFNLVENIGFREDSTHTSGASPYIKSETTEIKEIIEPTSRRISEKAEAIFVKMLHGINRNGKFVFYTKKNFIQRFYNLIHKMKLLLKQQSK